MLIFCVPLSGFSQDTPEIPEGLQVPSDSMESLQCLAEEIALAHQLEVKSIEILWETIHPGGRPGAKIYFQEQHLGDDVYEFTSVILNNSNWNRREINKIGSGWVKMPPASRIWTVWRKPHKYRGLKIQLGGRETFVAMGSDLDANQMHSYLNKFIEWANNNPSVFKHQLSKLSFVSIPRHGPPEYENKNMIRFSFNEHLRGVGYNFEIVDDQLVYIGESSWVS